jgi:hypothetical protein
MISNLEISNNKENPLETLNTLYLDRIESRRD